MSFAFAHKPDRQPHESPGFHLAGGALHEFYAAAEADGVSLCALAMMLAELGGGRAKLWVRHGFLEQETGFPHPPGVRELGFDPARLLFVRARDAVSALQAGLEGARSAGLGAVIVELRGETQAYDLTASRRLALAAKASGVPVFMLRTRAKAVASAAETRWLAQTALSRALAAKAPGHPVFHLILLRARNGQEGLRYHLEWNRDERRFETCLASGDAEQGLRPAAIPAAALSRAVAPLPAHRAGAARDEPPFGRRAG